MAAFHRQSRSAWVDMFVVAMMLSDAPVGAGVLRDIGELIFPTLREMDPFRAARLLRASLPYLQRKLGE